MKMEWLELMLIWMAELELMCADVVGCNGERSKVHAGAEES